MALGKPAIGTPSQLDLRPIATAISNARQRIEAIESLFTTTNQMANTTVNSNASQISALQQAITLLKQEIANISTAAGGAIEDASLVLAQRTFQAPTAVVPLNVDDASLTIAQQALQRHMPMPPLPPSDSQNILAVQIFGA